MSTQQGQSPTGRSNMGRELLWLQANLSNSCRKYFVTLGLRSMKWDEWIGEPRQVIPAVAYLQE